MNTKSFDLKLLTTENRKLTTLLLHSSKNFLTFIRFSHTLFALPFALGSMLVAAHGWPGWKLFGLIVGCMVFARTAAMSFNRIVDWEIDQRNPRTSGRHQLLKKSQAIFFCSLSVAFFVVTASAINNLCFVLAPVAIAVIFFYSLTKRFTHFAQFFLGLALAVSPVGAWIAVTGKIAFTPLILAAGVLCWVAGFDIIYATQDEEIDRKEDLHSMVVWLGVPRALRLAGWLHFLLFVVLIAFGVMNRQHLGYYLFLAPVPLLLFYEHKMAATLQLDLINRAFFQTNVVVGFLFLLATYFGV
ncbi:MAG: 4-hydroxybenzoate octaprenyltransferase [Chthoniobacterales bacterium]